jgi:uncharacterized protein
MKKVALLVCLLTLVFTTWAQRAVPELWGHRIHDEAHILTQATADNLEATLRKHEDSTTNQIAVLIIPSLDGEVLEEYSMRVAHDVWKLGTKNNDNGVLLLIAVDDRKMRIEVGYGLEGVLTDALTSRIIRNEIAPHFRDQEYDAGVTAGVNAIVAAIGNEYRTADSSSDTSENSSLEMDMTWQERLLIGTFIFGILGIFTAIGIFIPGCGGWFMYAFLIPFYAVFPLAVVGVTGGMILLGIYTIGFPIVKILLGRSAWGKNVMSNLQSGKGSGGKRGGGGGWASGSGWSSGRSSGWSSGGSSGGFSGGGGSFGGGGSSGSW